MANTNREISEIKTEKTAYKLNKFMTSGGGLIASVLFITSVAWAVPLPSLPNSEASARLAEFDYVPFNGKTTPVETKEGPSCTRTKLTIEVKDPRTSAIKSVLLWYERPLTDHKVPAVLIVPTIEGVTALEPQTADNLCGAGMAGIIAEVNDPEFPTVFPSWAYEDQNDRFAIMALRTAIDFVSQQPEIDASKIGIIGLSLGGITTSMLAGVEPDRLKAIVSVVGGGNLPHILSYSDHGRVSTFRANRMKAAGYNTVDQYENQLRSTVKLDPAYFAQFAKRENIFMIMADNDTKVPSVAQTEQFESFGKPSGLVYSGGHVDTLIKVTYFDFAHVTEFLNAKFNGRSFDKFGFVGKDGKPHYVSDERRP
jgi:dienelactone hydrolase